MMYHMTYYNENCKQELEQSWVGTGSSDVDIKTNHRNFKDHGAVVVSLLHNQEVVGWKLGLCKYILLLSYNIMQ